MGGKRGSTLVKPRWEDAAGSSVAESVDAYVRTCIDYYDRRAKWHRRLFRMSGVLSIVIGAGLPVLTAFKFGGKDVVIALAGYLVAIATGMRGFYRWDSSWVLLRQTQITISREYRRWRISSGSLEPAERERAAQELMDRVEAIRAKETIEFFDGMPELGSSAAKRPE